MHRKFTLVFAAAVLLLLIVPVFAQDDAVVSGLVNPRGITFDADGNLYVVEAGNGGSLTVEGPFGPTDAGGTGQVTRVSPDGEAEAIIMNLGSMTAGNPRGAQDFLVTEDSYWLLLGENSRSFPFSNALVELDKETLRVKTYVDLLTIELEQDPDGNPNGESNPTSFAVAPDGTVYIANAGCNCLLSWTREGGVQVAAAWPFDTDNPVPTSVAVGPDGDIYVGFLTGFPFPEGGSRIERWSGGALKQSYTGLTAVVDVLVTADGAIYATEFGVFNNGWSPGRVVMVTESAITPLLEGLNAPWGLALDPAGGLFVSVGAAGGGNGTVVQVPMQ